MIYRKGRNPELDRTHRDDPSKMTPGRQHPDGICHCAGTRFAVDKCLENLKRSCESREIIKKKWACAQNAFPTC